MGCPSIVTTIRLHRSVISDLLCRKNRDFVARSRARPTSFWGPRRKKAITEAATELLGQRGVDGATTAEIARRANVTEKTLSRYFPSKKDLVKRVLFPPLLREIPPNSYFDGID